MDSGIGGLSVVRHIRRRLPAEDVVYLADVAYAPYGGRPAEEIRDRVLRIGEFLARRRCKAVVLACNTASAVGVDALRARLAVPVVAMEPAVKPATALTRSAVVGVLATTATLTSPRYAVLRERYRRSTQILERACDDWVRQVETGDLTSAAARRVVTAHIEPLLRNGADTLVLGCTHFHFLAPLIREVAGATVEVIDPSAAVAEQLARRLTELGQLCQGSRGRLALLATDRTRVSPAASQLILPDAGEWEPVEV